MEWAETVHQHPQRAGAHVTFTGDSFIVRAVISNKGKGTLRNGLLNIVVPATCELEVLDLDKTHYVSPMVDTNAVLSGDGSLTYVRFSVARDDYFPGAHVYHVRVTPMHKSKGPYPVVLDLSGDALPPDGSSRIVRVVFRHAKRD
jgi:hypothetical protein